MIGLKLEKHKSMSITDEIGLPEQPKYLYFPLICGTNQEVIPLVKKGDYVMKGTSLAKTKGTYPIELFSSISGTVIDTEEHYTFNGEKVNSIKIENDFKELMNDLEIPDIKAMNREEFTNFIKEKGIVGLSGNGFPTYVKYQGSTPIKTLIVNAVECEPYITADYMLLKKHTAEVLEGIHDIMKINHIDEAYLAIKINNDEIKELIHNLIGTYPEIKLIEVPNLYPMGWEKSLVQYIKHVDYKNLPIEKNIVVDNVATIYAIYEALHFGKPLMERIITFTGEMFKKPQNMLLKVGTPINEIIESLGLKRNRDIVFIAGGPMMGKSLPSEELIMTSNLNCVLIQSFQSPLTSSPCIRCGKCVQVCPAKITPVLIKDNINDIDCLKNLKVNNCISCGLCSYICPAQIRVREYVALAKANLKKEDNQ